MSVMILISVLLMLTVAVRGDVKHILNEEITTLPPPPRPYAFGYAAGRFPGHIDRTHSEVSYGTGVVQGSYSYVDPRHQIRTVEYVADKDGFHPILNQNPPALPLDTPVVANAKQRHLNQYARIASQHQIAPENVIVPKDSLAVQYAKNRHFSLFQKIAEEHAQIAAQREAERAGFEITSEQVHTNLLEH